MRPIATMSSVTHSPSPTRTRGFRSRSRTSSSSGGFESNSTSFESKTCQEKRALPSEDSARGEQSV